MPRGTFLLIAQMRLVLDAEEELDLAELRRLKSRARAEHVAKAGIVGRRKGREDVPAERHHRLDAGHTRQALMDLDQRIPPDEVARKPQLMDDRLQRSEEQTSEHP